MRRQPALVVDGDPGLRERAADAFSSLGLTTVFVARVDEALATLAESGASIVLLDARSGAGMAETFLSQSLRIRPEAVPLVVAAAEAEAPLLDAGAFEVVPRAPSFDALERAVRRAARQHERLVELARLRTAGQRRPPIPLLVGRAENLAAFRERLADAAASDDPVLVAGEAGSGLSLSARLLHALSARGGGPFVRVDAAEGPAARAIERIVAAAEDARGGVLHVARVDELAEIAGDPAAAALVSVVGGNDVRLVSTAAEDLSFAVAEHGFDAKLAADLSVRVLRIPALRDRGRDALVLAQHFLEAARRRTGEAPLRLSPSASHAIESYSWPGNVRELKDAIDQAQALATHGVIQPEHLRAEVHRGAATGSATGRSASARRFRDAKRKVVDSFERTYLEELLAWHEGNVTTAAEQAGMLRSALQRLLRKHEMRSEAFRRRSARRPRLDS